VTENEEESTCICCGRCCRKKFLVDRGAGPIVVASDVYCDCYDVEEGECGCYNDRFVVASWCLNREQMVDQRAVPSDCPYAAGIEGYVGPVEATQEELEAYHERHKR